MTDLWGDAPGTEDRGQLVLEGAVNGGREARVDRVSLVDLVYQGGAYTGGCLAMQLVADHPA